MSDYGTGTLLLTALRSIQQSLATLVTNTSSLGAPVSVTPPASASATGTAGSLATDGTYLYVCVATNSWMRVALETF